MTVGDALPFGVVALGCIDAMSTMTLLDLLRRTLAVPVVI
jgi:hypothetical protein